MNDIQSDGEPMWVRMGWLRLVIFTIATLSLASLWTWAAAPDPNEVDPPDDMLPVYQFLWLFICVSGVAGFLLSELLVARWRSRTLGLLAGESARRKDIDPYA